MDNVTHSLAGVLLSRAGLNRLAPQAGWLIVASANLPDLDVVAGLAGPIAYLDWHRGWTHSVLLAPVLALVPWLVWRLLVRSGSALGGYLCALAGVLSHALLDWTNVYGIRLLSPWREEWLRLDIFYIVDLWIWLILLLAMAGPLLSRLVNAEIGARSRPGRAGAWVALLALLAYAGVRHEAHRRAEETLASRIYPEGRVLRLAALPGPANPLRWTGVVELPTAFRVYQLDLLREFDPDAARLLYKPSREDALAAARQSPVVAGAARFNQLPCWRVLPVSEPEGGTEVKLFDLRFGLPEEGRFTATAILDAQQRVVRDKFEFGSIGVTRP